MEGAKDVLYFTHDYFANSADKNKFIQATAQTAKKHGIQRAVAVCPIEHELYYTEDNKTPLEHTSEAQHKALQINNNFTILNTNLVFGRDSYLVHYMTQCAASGKIPHAIGSSQGY